jgi:NAD(P)-dependent dehydrogenase (short-subunit alcohol dehydrogenase family)
MRILLTGCNSGIGKSLRESLIKKGHQVVGLGLGGPDITWDFANTVGDLWANKLFADYGPFDALINNAGFTHIGLIEDHQTYDFEKILRINLIAPYALTRAFVRASPKSPAFRKIICTSSMGAVQGMTGSQGYCASKAGLEAVVRTLSREFAGRKLPFGIYAVAPGVVEGTKVRDYVLEHLVKVRSFTPEAAQKYFDNSSPHGHPASHEECIRIFHYILENATKFESGNVYRAPGGAGI